MIGQRHASCAGEQLAELEAHVKFWGPPMDPPLVFFAGDSHRETVDGCGATQEDVGADRVLVRQGPR